jgi:hypothetical protein
MRTRTYTDRGYGIGGHKYENTLRGDFSIERVRQIIVWDVFGERHTRYDIRTRRITDLACRPVPPNSVWAWEQVEEVVVRDLAPYGIAFGKPYRLIADRVSRR